MAIYITSPLLSDLVVSDTRGWGVDVEEGKEKGEEVVVELITDSRDLIACSKEYISIPNSCKRSPKYFTDLFTKESDRVVEGTNWILAPALTTTIINCPLLDVVELNM